MSGLVVLKYLTENTRPNIVLTSSKDGKITGRVCCGYYTKLCLCESLIYCGASVVVTLHLFKAL